MSQDSRRPAVTNKDAVVDAGGTLCTGSSSSSKYCWWMMIICRHQHQKMNKIVPSNSVDVTPSAAATTATAALSPQLLLSQQAAGLQADQSSLSSQQPVQQDHHQSQLQVLQDHDQSSPVTPVLSLVQSLIRQANQSSLQSSQVSQGQSPPTPPPRQNQLPAISATSAQPGPAGPPSLSDEGKLLWNNMPKLPLLPVPPAQQPIHVKPRPHLPHLPHHPAINNYPANTTDSSLSSPGRSPSDRPQPAVPADEDLVAAAQPPTKLPLVLPYNVVRRSIQLLGDKIHPPNDDVAGGRTCCVQLGQLDVGGVAHPSLRGMPALVRVLPCYGSEELNKDILEVLRLEYEAFEGSDYLLRIERVIEKRRRISIMHGTESPMTLPAHALGGVDEGPCKDHCYLQASSLMKEGFQTLFVWAKSSRIPLPSKMMQTLTWAAHSLSALNALHPLRPHGALSPHSCIILPGKDASEAKLAAFEFPADPVTSSAWSATAPGGLYWREEGVTASASRPGDVFSWGRTVAFCFSGGHQKDADGDFSFLEQTDTPETRMEMPVPTRPLARVLQRVLQATESEAMLRPTAKDLMALHLFSNNPWQLGTEQGMLDFVFSQCKLWKDNSDTADSQCKLWKDNSRDAADIQESFQRDLWQGDSWLDLVHNRVWVAIGKTVNRDARKDYNGRTAKSLFKFVRNILAHSTEQKGHRVSSMAYECMTKKSWSGSMDSDMKQGTLLRYALWIWPNLLVVLMLLAASRSEELISSQTGCSMWRVMQVNMQGERAESGDKPLYDEILKALAHGVNNLSELGAWLASKGVRKPGTGGLKKFIEDKMQSTVKVEGNISIRRL